MSRAKRSTEPTQLLGVHIPNERANLVRQLAAENGVSISLVMRQILEEALPLREPPKPSIARRYRERVEQPTAA